MHRHRHRPRRTLTEEWKRKRVGELYWKWRRWKDNLKPEELDLKVVTAHDAYKKMAEFGWTAVHFILSQFLLGDVDYYVFPILSAVTGAQPVLDGDNGHLKAMARDWIQWGEKQKSKGSVSL